MSNTTLHPTAPAVNTPLLLPAPDPVSAVVRYANQRDITFTIALEEIRAYSVAHPATTDWKRSVLAAAERLADTERADEQRARNEYRRAQSSYSQPRTGWCRQCHKSDCGHLRRGGR